MAKTKEERLEYIEKRLTIAVENYDKCKSYFKVRNMPDEESDQEQYCGYFKYLIKYWEKKLEDEKREGN
jgi:hypothetical protein